MWKVQLTIAINFISSKDTDKNSVMHSKSDNIEITISNKAEEVIEELLQSLPSRYQVRLEISMKIKSLSLIVFIYRIKNVIK